MTFPKPKMSPSTFASAIKSEVANIATGARLHRREGRVVQFDAFRFPPHLMWKRGVDILLSIFSIAVTSPVMMIAAILIKATSQGPVLIKQQRIGLNRRRIQQRHRQESHAGGERRRSDRRLNGGYGKPFTMYKFRTMVTDAEKDGKPRYASKGDPRITPLGRILRKARIDEFPQFFNVLKGDMSIVGPRPERAYFLDQINGEIPTFKYRLRTKPGITGLAQIELGYANDTEGMRRKLGFDLKYIQSISIFSDIKILYKTIFVVLTGKGAY